MPTKQASLGSIAYWVEESPCLSSTIENYGNAGYLLDTDTVPEQYRSSLIDQLKECCPQELEVYPSTQLGYPYSAHNKLRKLRIIQQPRPVEPTEHTCTFDKDNIEDFSDNCKQEHTCERCVTKRKRGLDSSGYHHSHFQVDIPPLPRLRGWPKNFMGPAANMIDVNQTSTNMINLWKDLSLLSQYLSKLISHIKYQVLVQDLQIGKAFDYIFFSLISEYHMFISEFPVYLAVHGRSKSSKARKKANANDCNSSVMIIETQNSVSSSDSESDNSSACSEEDRTRRRYHDLIKTMYAEVNAGQSRLADAFSRNIKVVDPEMRRSKKVQKLEGVDWTDLADISRFELQLLQHQIEMRSLAQKSNEGINPKISNFKNNFK